MRTILQSCPPECAIFVDTPGLNPWNAAEVAQARQWVAASGGEPIWIASAELSPDDMTELASLYRSLGARRMIATKLDTAKRWGGVPAAAAQGPIALAGTIASAYLADGIEPPNYLTLARRMLAAAEKHSELWTPLKEAKTA
jgi:flagellar biosynthesis protein FlhF